MYAEKLTVRDRGEGAEQMWAIYMARERRNTEDAHVFAPQGNRADLLRGRVDELKSDTLTVCLLDTGVSP